MKRTDDRLLPLVLLGAQAAVWPGADLIRGSVPAGSALFVAALVAGLVTAALSLRRSKPVIALDVALTAGRYAAASAAGILVRRSRRTRQAAEQRLKRAELERHRLPAVERR